MKTEQDMKHKIRAHGLPVTSDTTTHKLMRLVSIVEWCEYGGMWCDVHNPNKPNSQTLCRNCGKETYNENKKWSGYCSQKCEVA